MDRSKYKKEMVAWHRKALKTCGLTERALGWGSKEGMEARFNAACEVKVPGTLKGTSVLDVGCGFGDFLPVLLKQGVRSYNGIDLVPEFVDAAMSRYQGTPYVAWNFSVKDVFEFGPEYEGCRDVVFALGVAWRAGGKEYLRDLMKKCFELCDTAAVISVSCDTTLGEKEGSNLMTPAEMVEYSRDVVDRFVVRHDFWPNDLMVYLYKEKWRML